MYIWDKYKTLISKYGLTTTLRKAHFFAQARHECGNFEFKPISENLNYSESGLRKIFPKYFKENEFKEFARHPEKIANRVYANRLGNGNEASGEGWTYRGRGIFQLTGKDNYNKYGKLIGLDLVNNPDLLLQEANSLLVALEYWKNINGNYYADKDDILSITKKINGGTNGLEDRKKWLKYYKGILR